MKIGCQAIRDTQVFQAKLTVAMGISTHHLMVEVRRLQKTWKQQRQNYAARGCSQTNPTVCIKGVDGQTTANLSICRWNEPRVPGSRQTEGGGDGGECAVREEMKDERGTPTSWGGLCFGGRDSIADCVGFNLHCKAPL